MKWKNAERSTVGRDWGRAPSLVEVIPATIRLPPAGKNGPPVVHALNAAGQRVCTVPVRNTDAGCAFEIGPPFATLWYEIVYGEPPTDHKDSL